MVTIAEAIKNYKTVEEIGLQLEVDGLEYWLKINPFRGDIIFFHCEYCGGLTLGHRAMRCRQFGNKYVEEVVKKLKHWMRRHRGFRKAVRRKTL